MSIIGELDVYENKLYIELHNFDFLSFNNSQTAPTYQVPKDNPKPTLTALSEKRSLMYQSLFENTKGTQSTQPRKRKQQEKTDNVTPPTSHQEMDSASMVESDQESKTSNKRTTTSRRQLRSKKVTQLASDRLNLPSYEES